MQSNLRTIVLIDTPGAPSSGAWSRFAFSDITWPYARSLARHMGERVRVVIVGSYRESPDIPGVEVVTVRAETGDLRNVGAVYLLLRRYAKVIARLAPSMVHSSDYLALAVVSRRLPPDVVRVLTTPGSILERRSTFNPYDVTYTKFLEWAVSHLRGRTTKVIATSAYMRHWWERSGFPSEDVVVLPLPTSSEAGGGTSRDALRAEMGWPTGVRHLLVAAALRRENRVDLAVRLIARYLGGGHPGRTTIHLHIVGGGELMQETQALVVDLGMSNYVTFHGGVDAPILRRFYLGADALLVPRRFNATPRTAQEAMFSGLPIIANLNQSLNGFGLIQMFVKQIDFESSTSGVDLEDALAECLAMDCAELRERARGIFGEDSVGRSLSDLCAEWVGA